MALMILRNTSCEMSVNGMIDTLKAAGNSTGWEKACEVAALFRQAYLSFEVYEYSHELLAGGSNPSKLYAVDPGLAFAVSRASQEDVGKRLETATYLELRRRMAGRRTGIPTGTVVTLLEDGRVNTEHGTVDIVPAWEWFPRREQSLSQADRPA